MTTPEFPPPTTFSPHSLQEYVETLMLVEDIDHLSIAELTSRFRAGQKPKDTDWATIRPSVRQRQDQAPELYPYEADEEGVLRVGGIHSAVYDYLLLLSLEHAPYRQAHDYNRTNKILDWLVREALKSHLGPSSDGVRFGTPVQDGRPQDFNEAVTWLSRKMRAAEGVKDRPADMNDGGVDVVVWRHMPDGRAGFDVLLAQCTVEMNWPHKATQIPLEGWKQWLDLGQPRLVLAIPFTVPENDDRWLTVRYWVGLPFDRMRLCARLRDVDLTAHEEWQEMLDFIRDERARLVNDDGPDDRKHAQVPRKRKQKMSDQRDPQRR